MYHVHIDQNNKVRFLGNLSGGPVDHTKVYGDSVVTPMFARSQWPSLCRHPDAWRDHPCLPPVHDQNGVGQCNADAVTAAMEYCRAAQGLPHVQLSAADLYARINRGGDNGSLLEDGMAEAEFQGVGTAATCGTLWKRGMTLASKEERGRFRVLESWLCPTFDHCFSAAAAGFGLISGILWYDNFKPDKDGWLPRRGTGGGGGHAVFGYMPTMDRSGNFGIAHQNSWTRDWGIEGKCVFPEEHYHSAQIGGWWAVRQVVTEQGDTPPLRS